MAGRLAWIIAGGAAIVGGMVFQDDWFKFESRDREQAIEQSIDAKADRMAEARVQARIVDGEGRRIDADPEAVRALTDAVGELVKAEAALAIAKLDEDSDPADVKAAEEHRDNAKRVVDELKADLEARQASGAVTRDQVREQVRAEVREAVRGN